MKLSGIGGRSSLDIVLWRKFFQENVVNQVSNAGVREDGTLHAASRRKRLGISTYRRVAALLRRRISSGEWQPGDRLPALDALVEELGVGRVTVRHALDLLADEGLVARHRDRRGSSVIAHPLDRRWFTLALNLAELETHSASVIVSEIESGLGTARCPLRRRRAGRAVPITGSFIFTIMPSFPIRSP